LYGDTPDELTVAAGEIATIAGREPDDPQAEPQQGGDGDDGRARQAVFHGNTAVAVVGDRLYVAAAIDRSSPQARVWLVNLGDTALSAHGRSVAPGGIRPIAGGEGANGELASAAAIAVDGEAVYVADPVDHRVHRVDAEGFVGTYAGAEGLGSNVGGFDGNGQPAVGARLNHPVDVAVGGDGKVYVSDRRNGQVRVVHLADGRIRAVIGSGIAQTWRCHPPGRPATGDSGDGGEGEPPAQPQPGGPAAVAATSDGTAYFALADQHRIKRRNRSGTVTHVAGTGKAGFGGDGGPAGQATLNTPTAVALGRKGDTLYVYDGGNARVRAINLAEEAATIHGVTIPAGAIATVAGSDTPGHGGDGGPAVQAQLASVAIGDTPGFVWLGRQTAQGLSGYVTRQNFGDLAVDANGHLFIADPPHYTDQQPPGQTDPRQFDAGVRHVTPEGTITTLTDAGDGDGDGDEECCANPGGLATDGDGNVYISDLATHQVWLYNRTDQPLHAHEQTIPAGQPAPIAGTGQQGFAGDGGPARQAQLLAPTALAHTDTGSVYVAEFAPDSGYIRRITPGGTIDLVAGQGQAGFNGDGRRPRLTRLNLPADLALDACGNILLADAGNDRLRRINHSGACDQLAQAGQPQTPQDDPIISPLLVGVLGVAAATGVVIGWRWRRHP
jgi:hypothetical protein